MHVSSIDLPGQCRPFRRELHDALDRLLRRGDFVFGEAVQRFEDTFARSCGTAYGVGVNSGTDALWLGLQSLGIRRGDDVITTPFTFVASASAIAMTGARPVFADIDASTYNLDPDRVDAAVTKRTKAILVVHLFGQPADMDRLSAIARRHRLALIEDCAHAPGARFHGRPVGSFGQFGAFSFYPTKNLGGLGDGGLVVTDRRAIRDRVRLLRDHGRQGTSRFKFVGRNSRLDSIQAAFLQVKLRRLAQWNRLRAQHARRYTRLLRRRPSRVVTPTVAPGRSHVYHVYTVRVPSRDRVMQQLARQGIRTMLHYRIPLHLQPAFRYLGYRRGRLPVAERASREVVSLPLYPEMPAAHIDHVAQQLIKLVDAS